MQMQPSKSYRAEFVTTLRLATPIMFNQLSHMLTQVTDSIMVGRLGTLYLAAASFSGAVFAFFMIFSFGFSSILSSWVAKAIGENNSAQAGSILRHGLVLNFFVSLICVVLLLVMTSQLSVFGQTPEVNQAAKGFLWYLALSLLPLCLFAVYTRFCEGVSDPGPVSLMSWMGVVLNLLLNWILIYGHFGLPAMGLNGSGLATLITRLVLLLVMMFYVHGTKRYRQYGVRLDFSDVSLAFLTKIFKTSLPSGLMHLNEVVAFASGGIMMGWLGAEALAAHHVALNLASCTFIVAMGWSFATTVRVAEEFGKQDFVAVRRVAGSSFISMIVLMSFTALLFVLLRNILPMIYTQDPAVLRLAAELLLIAALFQLFDGAQILGISLNKGIMDVRVPLRITVFAYWGLCLPLCYVLTFPLHLGPKGIWYGYLISLFAASLLLNSRFFYLVLVKKRSIELLAA